MASIIAYNKEIETVFDMVGYTENDITKCIA